MLSTMQTFIYGSQTNISYTAIFNGTLANIGLTSSSSSGNFIDMKGLIKTHVRFIKRQQIVHKIQ